MGRLLSDYRKTGLLKIKGWHAQAKIERWKDGKMEKWKQNEGKGNQCALKAQLQSAQGSALGYALDIIYSAPCKGNYINIEWRKGRFRPARTPCKSRHWGAQVAQEPPLCWFISIVTSVHINCYERSYQLLRAFVSIVTSLRIKWNEPTCAILLHYLWGLIT